MALGRIRSIKPEFWTSEQVVEMSLDARLLFIGMLNFADDRGVLPASYRSLKMKVFPGDSFTETDIARMVGEMLHTGLLSSFEEEGQKYWYVTGWTRHQKVDRPSYKYPLPPQGTANSTSIRRAFDEHSANARDGVEWSGVDSKGKESVGVYHARTHEGKDFFDNETPTEVGPIAALPEKESDYCYRTISEYLRPDDWSRLRTIVEKADYDPEVYGTARDEIEDFIQHHLGTDKRKALLNDPVTHFERQFPGWLRLAKKYNPGKKDGKTKKDKYRATIEEAKAALGDKPLTYNAFDKARKAAESAENLRDLLKKAVMDEELYSRPTTLRTRPTTTLSDAVSTAYA